MSKATTQIFLRSLRDFLQSEQVAALSHTIPSPNSDQPAIDLSEVTLKARFSYEYQIKYDCLMILVPLVGKIHVEETIGIDVGDCWSKSLKIGEIILLKNPYETTENHFLRIQIPFVGTVKSSLSSFSNDKLKNKIYQIFSLHQDQEILNIGMGKFDGRAETEFQVKRSVFVYSLVGAFEVQNCLLEKGDALKIIGNDTIELEALSNDAVILTLEM
ncbi:hypothetical protein SYJ56_02800 [Algoriphagus sp. D3-2-R+10]|uniref:pirin family protein n=1 Tax=Algoriphagus aurantiacus TaxID=3103948 RepID=UPI002B36C4C4|nr:hypothetical protein [Algoriphagus sp. D3-2-R+10]MEB2774216.1 hypothetical protein [Algoriphagus sp. D3-2-R+10]